MSRPAVLTAVAVTIAFMWGRSAINVSHPIGPPCAEDARCAAEARDPSHSPGYRDVLLAQPVMELHAWLRNDLEKTPLRLAALAACLLAAWSLGGPSLWGWHARLPRGAAWLLVLDISVLAAHVAGATPAGFSAAEAGAGLLSTVPVALWEEACYRGLLYLGLRRSWSPLRAGAASSLLFVFMHVGVMPFTAWIHIFVSGLAMCAALELGAGLAWLALAHWTVDAVALFATGGTMPDSSAGIWLSRLIMIALFWRSLEILQRPDEAEPAPAA